MRGDFVTAYFLFLTFLAKLLYISVTNHNTMQPSKPWSEQNNAEQAGVTPHVKTVMQVCYKAHLQAGSIIKGKIDIDPPPRNPNFHYTFNTAGYFTEAIVFNTYYNERRFYNEERKLVKTTRFKDKNTITELTHCTYDDKGNSIEYITTDPDGSLKSRYVHTYNADNKKLSDHNYVGTEQRLYAYTLFTYDERGNMLTNTRYKGDGTVEYCYELQYNEKNLKISDTGRYTNPADAKFNSHTTYRYNEHGDCIEMVIQKGDSHPEVLVFTYEYDADGKRIRDNPSTELYPKAAGETETFEYDERGNWIKKTVTYKNIPAYIVERQLIYFDDNKPATLTHPLENSNAGDIAEVQRITEELLTDEMANCLAESNNLADQFPLTRYYTMRYKEYPSLATYLHPHIEVTQLLKILQTQMGAVMLHSYASSHDNHQPEMSRYTLCFPAYPGYLLHVYNIGNEDSDAFELPPHMHAARFYPVETGQLMLLKPGDAYGQRDEFFEDELERFIETCMLDKRPEKPVINIIEVAGDNFVLKEHSVDDNFEIKDLDINYGYGFQQFHESLMHRFAIGTKGLVLFHGEPGTGKTYYIRHLLRTMVANKKEVIYMPPNMVDHLSEPSFMTFLMETVKNLSQSGNFCVLLIEDAEPLLARRQEGVRIQGITNLLNMSDGILNDLLNIQIICTFNIGVKKLDSALLRPGRLIARKEFKPLSVIDANRLGQRIGLKHHFKTPATLGEIYALLKNNNTIVHEVDYDENSTDLIDDIG
jgi:hypothetical protein